jgi:hypothetical protein
MEEQTLGTVEQEDCSFGGLSKRATIAWLALEARSS